MAAFKVFGIYLAAKAIWILSQRRGRSNCLSLFSCHWRWKVMPAEESSDDRNASLQSIVASLNRCGRKMLCSQPQYLDDYYSAARVHTLFGSMT